jgi:hypothetical protein
MGPAVAGQLIQHNDTPRTQILENI